MSAKVNHPTEMTGTQAHLRPLEVPHLPPLQRQLLSPEDVKQREDPIAVYHRQNPVGEWLTRAAQHHLTNTCIELELNDIL